MDRRSRPKIILTATKKIGSIVVTCSCSRTFVRLFFPDQLSEIANNTRHARIILGAFVLLDIWQNTRRNGAQSLSHPTVQWRVDRLRWHRQYLWRRLRRRGRMKLKMKGSRLPRNRFMSVAFLDSSLFNDFRFRHLPVRVYASMGSVR